MDSKKKLPLKKLGKKQLKSYAILDGRSVAEMSKEQLESHIFQLQQEVEKEREERGYFQLERDKIQLFWEVSKQQLEEKDMVLQMKDREIDEAALSHLAEIKLYKQKVKHIMFECQQHISDKMKEKLGEKLTLEEEHLVQVKDLEMELTRLKDGNIQITANHENDLMNQKMKHGEELCLLHKQYQYEIDIIKSKEVAEIGKIRHELDLQRRKAIQAVEDNKDAHIQHLIEIHEELFQKMKNYYNDIIKNDLLLIHSLKEQLQGFLKKERHYKESLKNLNMGDKISDPHPSAVKSLKNLSGEDNNFSEGSVIRNLRRELSNVKQENSFLYSQLLRANKEDQERTCSYKSALKRL